MSININLTDGELDLLLSSLNYLNEEQEIISGETYRKPL